jgi:hypothetical protein
MVFPENTRLVFISIIVPFIMIEKHSIASVGVNLKMKDKIGKFRAIVALLTLLMALIGNSAGAATQDVITRDLLPESCFKGTREDVVSMVDKAVNLVAEKGPIAAFRQFMIPDGGYIKGDLYVFVLNSAGTIVANGAYPGAIGSNTIQSRDRKGRYFIRNILQQASSQGHGWVDYEWFSPCT